MHDLGTNAFIVSGDLTIKGYSCYCYVAVIYNREQRTGHEKERESLHLYWRKV